MALIMLKFTLEMKLYMKRELRVRLERERGLGRLKLVRDAGGRRVLHIPEGVSEETALQFLDGYAAGLPAAVCRNKEQTLALIRRMLPEWTARLSLDAAPAVRLGTRKGLWGRCCLQERAVELSEQCCGLPEQVIETLLVHELCHLRVADHRPAFWQLMTDVLPDWAVREGMLRRGKA